MKLAFLMVLGTLALAAGGAEAKDYETWPIFLVPHGTAESKATVKSGERCLLTFGGGSMSASATRITQNPTAGKVAVSNNRVIYQARPGFTGSDEFTSSREGVDQTGKPAPMAVPLKVDVVP